MKITNLYTKKEESINLLPLIRHWTYLTSSEDLKLFLTSSEMLTLLQKGINRDEKPDMYQINGILFNFSKHHPTFDFLSLRFDNAQLVTDAVFYNMTLSNNHSLNINAHFISYVSLLLDINKKVNLEFCYVTSEKNYSEFEHHKYPPSLKMLDIKLQNLEKSGKPENELDLEKISFQIWEKEYKWKFKYTNL